MTPTAERRAVVRCLFCQTPNRVDLTKLSLGPKCANCHRPILLDRPLKVTGADFDQTIQGTTVPVAVDFYADWCGPCHMMAPTLDALANDRKGEVLVLKVDTEKDPALAARFDIRGLPTVVAFRDGKETGRQVGVAPRPVLDRLVG